MNSELRFRVYRKPLFSLRSCQDQMAPKLRKSGALAGVPPAIVGAAGTKVVTGDGEPAKTRGS